MGMGFAGSLFDFLPGGFRVAIPDIFPHRSTKEENVLRNKGHRSAQGRKGKFGDRITINEKSPILRIVKAQKQREEGGFTRSALANKGNPLAACGPEGDSVEDCFLGTRGVGKAHVLRLHRAQHFEGRFLTGRCFRLFAQDLTQSFGGTVGLLNLTHDLGESPKGRPHENAEEDEGRELKGRNLLPGQHAGTEPGHH